MDIKALNILNNIKTAKNIISTYRFFINRFKQPLILFTKNGVSVVKKLHFLFNYCALLAATFTLDQRSAMITRVSS